MQRENEAKERELRDLEAFVKKENAERKKETRAIEEARMQEAQKRDSEAAELAAKMEKEKKEMQASLFLMPSSFYFCQNADCCSWPLDCPTPAQNRNY